MPDMANIVIKKADGTTDITYVKQAASAGDKVPAIWKCDGVGIVLAGRPSLHAVAADNGTKKARRIRTSFVYPKVRQDPAGNAIVLGGIVFDTSAVIAQDMTMTEINEACNQFANLFASSLIRSVHVSGYAPT